MATRRTAVADAQAASFPSSRTQAPKQPGGVGGSGPGGYRYVVERTFAWYKGFRRRRRRHERTAFMHEAVLSVALGVVCFRHL